MSDQPGGFVAIPTHIMRNRDLTPTARCVFGVILSYAWGRNPCTASNHRLTEVCGVSRTALYDALKQLKAAGLVKVKPGSQWTGRRIWPIPTGGLLVTDPDDVALDSGIRNQDTEVDVLGEEKGIESKEDSQEKEDKGETRARELRKANGVVALCDRLAELMRANDPKAKVAPASVAWMGAAEKLMRLDERHFEEAMAVLEFSQRDEFWKTVILSMPTFRKQYAKLRARWVQGAKAHPGWASAAAAPASTAELMAAYGKPRTRTGV